MNTFFVSLKFRFNAKFIVTFVTLMFSDIAVNIFLMSVKTLACSKCSVTQVTLVRPQFEMNCTDVLVKFIVISCFKVPHLKRFSVYLLFSSVQCFLPTWILNLNALIVW